MADDSFDNVSEVCREAGVDQLRHTGIGQLPLSVLKAPLEILKQVLEWGLSFTAEGKHNDSHCDTSLLSGPNCWATLTDQNTCNKKIKKKKKGKPTLNYQHILFIYRVIQTIKHDIICQHCWKQSRRESNLQKSDVILPLTSTCRHHPPT